MLSFQRQVCYWASSLSAVCLFRLQEHFMISSNLLFTYGIMLLAMVMLFSDYSKTRPGNDHHCDRRLPFYIVVAFCLVGLGHVAKACDGFWFETLEDERTARQNLVHAFLSFVCIADLEYWINDQSPDLYLAKQSNFLYPARDPDTPRLFSKFIRDEPDISKSTESRFKSLMETCKPVLWMFMLHAMSSILRLVWFGDFTFTMAFIFPCPYVSGELATKDLTMQKMIFLHILLLAPLRVAAQTVLASANHYVRGLIQRREAVVPEMEIMDGLDPDMR